MRKDIDQVFKQIRADNLDSSNKFVFELDLDDERISKSIPLTSDNEDFRLLKDKLSPSFTAFVRTIANGVHIEIGNALTILPVGQIEGYWSNVLTQTNEITKDSLFTSKDFIFFAMSGVDSEMFAFYTGTKFPNGEYPVIKYSPAMADTNPFVLLNSSFDKFLTIQFYQLKATDYEETYDSIEEAQSASLDILTMEQDETNWKNFTKKLYDNFDPLIGTYNQDDFMAGTTLTGLIQTLEQLSNNSR